MLQKETDGGTSWGVPQSKGDLSASSERNAKVITHYCMQFTDIIS